MNIPQLESKPLPATPSNHATGGEASFPIDEVPIAARSPWQSPYVQRLIGSIRRECLDHMIVLNQGHLRRIIASYLAYYYSARMHLSLNRGPEGRAVQPPAAGKVTALPRPGGLHHEYVRLEA